VVQFAPDGRVFVGEKHGQIVEFDSLSDPTPTLVANLATNVYDYSDRGLLGLALDPNFATNPYVYVLYTLDAPIGGTLPVYNDTCSDPNGCVAGARASRMLLDAHNHAGPEQVLIEDWCQQFDSHSIGTLAFGPEGALYVGGGDGASYIQVDYGQLGGNPCGDPANEGGALRAQDLVHRADPTGMNGAVLRVDPATGDAWPDNPLIGGDPTDDRIIAEGMRNPFRFAVKPGGSDRIWVGDVGWNSWEEIDGILSAGDSKVEDFGWPCYEGRQKQPGYEAANLPVCNRLYAKPSLTRKPFFVMSHGQGGCDGSNVFSAVGFYTGATFPADYAGSFFFGDVVRGCMWTMFAGPNGDPDPATLFTFGSGIFPVDVKTGPNGDLFYVDIDGGSIHEISYTG
jgi:glucose/arabinose dehydrogenase